ncbi:hypothetical protein [Catellatospora vulcania]|uniref:hypothetical protein n=1 Tax=Catellatospora vulcania TaxID=1460450 RepID=UPI0012D3A2B6|nr:hypothetical protein [Catellatospora vulcania]
MLRYPAALALTLAVEIPVYAAALRWGWSAPWRRAVLCALGVNLVTHPVLWWLLAPRTALAAYPLLMVVAEVVVCGAEAALLVWWLRRRDPLLAVLAVAANAASVLAGLIYASA